MFGEKRDDGLEKTSSWPMWKTTKALRVSKQKLRKKYYRAWRPPAQHTKLPGECRHCLAGPPAQSPGPGLPPPLLFPPGGNSCRTPVQEEHSDAHSALAKL